MKTPQGYIVYEEFEKNIEMLSNEDAGILYKAQNRYFFDGEAPDFSNCDKEGLKYTWPLIESKLSRDKRKYAIECLKRAYAADMKSFEENLTFAAWYEWRTARFNGCTDTILAGFSMDDMFELDSEKAYKNAKKKTAPCDIT